MRSNAFIIRVRVCVCALVESVVNQNRTTNDHKNIQIDLVALSHRSALRSFVVAYSRSIATCNKKRFFLSFSLSQWYTFVWHFAILRVHPPLCEQKIQQSERESISAQCWKESFIRRIEVVALCDRNKKFFVFFRGLLLVICFKFR